MFSAQTLALQQVKVPDMELQKLVFILNMVVFGMAALMYLVCHIWNKSALMRSSNKYASSNSLKESEINSEFVSNEEIV